MTRQKQNWLTAVGLLTLSTGIILYYVVQMQHHFVPGFFMGISLPFLIAGFWRRPASRRQ